MKRTAMPRISFMLLAMLFAVASSATAQTDPRVEFERAASYGKMYFDMKEYANAYEQFVKADALQPDHPAVLYNVALLLAKTNRFSESQIKVDRYLELYPSGAERPLIAKLELHVGFQRDLQRTRRLEQEYTDLFTKGRHLYGKNDLDGALKLFLEAEQRRASEPAAVFNQAVVNEKLGNYEIAVERYRRYLDLETDVEQKGTIDQHVVALEGEIDDMRTKVVCSFCGHKLPAGSTWCHRCWHGPYLTSSPTWNSRPCIEGASATRATFFGGDRFNKNESLPCIFSHSMREALAYSPGRQRAVQESRKAEGWTYSGEVIQGWRDKEGGEVRYMQGAEYLERIDSPSGGEILTYAAHKSGDVWLLDQEQWFIDGVKYTSRFTFDTENRISQQQVEYQNTAACNHLVSMSADYRWEGNRLAGASLAGGYTGFAAEGSPRLDWQATVVNTYDELGRVTKEDLTVGSFTKTYATKATRKEREALALLYPSMRVKKPIADLAKTGDFCGVSGGRYITNVIDLRPFYAISPNVAFALPPGVTRATVTMAYPPGFKP